MFFDIMLCILCIGSGIGVGYWINNKKNTLITNTAQTNSIILLNNIRKVCKLVTVEGDFVEIMTHNDQKSWFFNWLHFEKKALIIVRAKALVGFDLRKAEFRIDESNRTIYVTNFPQPEILSIEPEINYYDVQQSVFNKFDTNDHSDLVKKALDEFRQKLLQSHLPMRALEQANESLEIIAQMTLLMNWNFDYEEPKMLTST